MHDEAIHSHRRNIIMSARGSSSRTSTSTNTSNRTNDNDAPSSPLRRIRNAVATATATGSSPLRLRPRRRRSTSAPARITGRHLLVEDHYRVDPDDKHLLPGLPVNDDDWARDLHDFFNLVALVSEMFDCSALTVVFLVLCSNASRSFSPQCIYFAFLTNHRSL